MVLDVQNIVHVRFLLVRTVLVSLLLLDDQVLLIAGEGLLHGILDVHVFQAAVRVNLTRAHEVRVVAGDVVVGDAALEGVRVVVRVVRWSVLPARLELGRGGLDMAVQVLLQVLS